MPHLPMFPLSTVLFPHMRLPLHVFEERYRTLTRRCLDGDREFGVVLIDRGHEVGGGDVRTTVGTVARIDEAAPLEDGGFVLVTHGVRRIRVRGWLDDDPHPWADVVDATDPPASAAAQALVTEAQRRLQAVLDLLDADITVTLHPDAEVASHQAAALAPVGAFDAHRLLGADGHETRLELLLALLDEREELLRLERGGGSGSGDTKESR